MNKNILFIGANGYMGHGMSLNLLKQNNLYVIANRQRNNIENLIKEGAKEINSYQEIKNLDLDCLMLCVTNTPIAVEIANNVSPLLKNNTLVIDLTTHNKNGTTEMKDIFDKFNRGWSLYQVNFFINEKNFSDFDKILIFFILRFNSFFKMSMCSLSIELLLLLFA